MSYWERREAVLKLSSAGREVFHGIFETELITVFVEWADEHGIWVVRDSLPGNELAVLLIRWHHFDTAQIEVITAPQATARPLGFVR